MSGLWIWHRFSWHEAFRLACVQRRTHETSLSRRLWFKTHPAADISSYPKVWWKFHYLWPQPNDGRAGPGLHVWAEVPLWDDAGDIVCFFQEAIQSRSSIFRAMCNLAENHEFGRHCLARLFLHHAAWRRDGASPFLPCAGVLLGRVEMRHDFVAMPPARRNILENVTSRSPEVWRLSWRTISNGGFASQRNGHAGEVTAVVRCQDGTLWLWLQDETEVPWRPLSLDVCQCLLSYGLVFFWQSIHPKEHCDCGWWDADFHTCKEPRLNQPDWTDVTICDERP